MSSSVLILLGYANDAAGRLPAMSVARAIGAMQAYTEIPDLRLILTGGFGKFNPTATPHAYYVAQQLIAWGVREKDIIGLVESGNTIEDAILSRELLDGQQVNAIRIVTSAAHVERARWVFEHFFPPGSLTFIATPNCAGPERLGELQAHEARALRLLEGQGGIMVDGTLVTRKDFAGKTV